MAAKHLTKPAKKLHVQSSVFGLGLVAPAVFLAGALVRFGETISGQIHSAKSLALFIRLWAHCARVNRGNERSKAFLTSFEMLPFTACLLDSNCRQILNFVVINPARFPVPQRPNAPLGPLTGPFAKHLLGQLPLTALQGTECLTDRCLGISASAHRIGVVNEFGGEVRISHGAACLGRYFHALG